MSNSTKCYGAVLQHAEDSDRDFDVWVITTDFDTIIKAPDSDVVLCEEDSSDKETLERLVSGRHVAPLGCTVLDEYETQGSRSRRRHMYRDSFEAVRGWRVLRHPLVLDEHDDPISVARVRGLCVEHGTVLVDGSGISKLRNELRPSSSAATYETTDEALRAIGFVITSSGDFYKIRWNALSAAMQDWRKTSKSTSTRLVPHFTEKALAQVGYCVNPTNWPHEHPYAGMLSGREDYGFNGRSVDRYGNQVRRGSKGHRTEYSTYKIDEILKFIALNKKLCPKLKPWLDVKCSDYGHGRYTEKPSLVAALEECFQNIHAVEERCQKQRIVSKKEAQAAEVTLRFCRWLRVQARVLNVELPKPAKLPPKPTKRTVSKMLKAA